MASLSEDESRPPPGSGNINTIGTTTTDPDFSAPYRPRTSTSRRLSTQARQHPYSSEPPSSSSFSSFLRELTSTLLSLTQTSLRLYLSLTRVQRALVVLAGCAAVVTGVLFLVYSHRIFTALAPLAAGWRATPGGWLILWLVTVATAFPPAIGYSTCVTVAGFVYGFPLGWPIVASATIVGSTAAFLASRGWLRGYVHSLVGKDARFVALGQVLRRDGVGVLAMIRLCPLPYSLSNGFLATVGSIRVGGFALATGLATPKLLVHIFIGSRLALLAESGDKMSAGDRVINYLSMALGGLLGFGVGLLIYRRTMARAAELMREAELEEGGALLDAEGMEAGGAETDYDENDTLVHPDELDAAAIMDDDDISLWDTEGGDGYRDSWDEGAAKKGTVLNGTGIGNGHVNGVKN